jgi:membrane protein YdbS with pleckstrin-like domain
MKLTPLAPAARWLFYARAFTGLFFFWAPVCILLGSALLFLVPSWTAVMLPLSWFLLMFLYTVWYPTLAFERWGYDLRDEELIIGRGVLFRSITAIPLGRVQHVDTRQGPLEQWIGLARLQVYTASGMGADGVIPGLTIPDAEHLRDELLQIRGDDGV